MSNAEYKSFTYLSQFKSHKGSCKLREKEEDTRYSGTFKCMVKGCSFIAGSLFKLADVDEHYESHRSSRGIKKGYSAERKMDLDEDDNSLDDDYRGHFDIDRGLYEENSREEEEKKMEEEEKREEEEEEREEEEKREEEKREEEEREEEEKEEEEKKREEEDERPVIRPQLAEDDEITEYSCSFDITAAYNSLMYDGGLGMRKMEVLLFCINNNVSDAGYAELLKLSSFNDEEYPRTKRTLRNQVQKLFGDLWNMQKHPCKNTRSYKRSGLGVETKWVPYIPIVTVIGLWS